MTAELAHSVQLLPRLDEVDRDLQCCREELRATPLQLEAEAGALELLGEQLVEAESLLTASQGRLSDAQSTLAGLEKRLDRARSRVASLVSVEQIEATDREIGSLEAQCSDAETEVLEAMEALESHSDRKALLSTQLEAGQGAQEGRQAEWAGRSSELESRVEALDATRTELASGVRSDVLRLYEAALGRGMIGASRPSGITQVDARFICSTCHARVPPAWVQEARNFRSAQTCDGCRRLLVLVEVTVSGESATVGHEHSNPPT